MTSAEGLTIELSRQTLSESRLNRRLYEIDSLIWQSIFHATSEIFKNNTQSLEYLVDSLPVEVCLNGQCYRCR